MLRDVVHEAISHPWRTLAEAVVLLALVAGLCLLDVMVWAVMQP